MRLKEVYISSYKNLSDFTVKFDGDNFIEVFVGKNGTGKSNFFEALLKIFNHLFNDDETIEFSYKLKYKKAGVDYFIHWDWDNDKWLKENGEETTKEAKTNLPENVLLYYSGHNVEVNNVVSKYEEKHYKLLDNNRNNVNLLETVSRQFCKIDSEYKSILLTVLLLQSDENKAKLHIKDKLGIAGVGSEMQIDFKRPAYAIGNDDLSFDEVDADKRFWSPQGYFKQELDKIWEVGINEEADALTRPKGKIDEDTYILYRDFISFQEKFNSYSPLDLFIAFDNLKTIGYLKDILLDVTLTNGKTINIDQFSDGQFQTIYIYAITELFKDKDCITLLDEPDSFLHPEWQHQFLNQVYDISDESAKTNHVLMSSHSAVSLINYNNEKIGYFDLKEGTCNNYNLPKRLAIERLSDSLIQYTEQEQILSIINTIQIEQKPVLFTEGKTDPFIIKEAWYKLYPEEDIPFLPFYAFGHRFVTQVMKDPEVINDMDGLPIFGLFDFDKAFNSWNGFSNTDIEEDVYKGLIKQIDSVGGNPAKNVYAIMLPVPKGKEITKQVVNQETGEHWKDRALMGIEHLFMDVPDFESLFKVDESRPSKFKIFIGDKVSFAKTEIQNVPEENFEVFKPMFEFIKSMIPAEVVQ